MSNQDPEWRKSQQTHNALTVLNLALFAQPLIMFGVLYWALGFSTDFSKTTIIGLAFLAACFDWLILRWLIKKLRGKGNRIG